MKIGVLTGGGDCPGLNPAIRGVVMRGLDFGHTMIGLCRGWAGLIEADQVPLDLQTAEDIINQGGTILESSRTNPFKKPEDLKRALDNFRALGLDCLIALGGEDTLGVANRFYKEHKLPTIGVPKTMDNDLAETDYTFGFDSAVHVAVEAADRLKDTARSHRRFMVLEVMGRHAGWVALWTAAASGADWALLPEIPVDLEAMFAALKRKIARGKKWGLIVVSEGIELPESESGEKALDSFGHEILKNRGVGQYLADQIEARLKVETRSAVLGHIIRGGAPTPFDRILASRVGMKAMEMANAGQFGHMACLKGTEIVAVPLEAAVAKLKTVPQELYQQLLPLFNK